MGLLRRKPVATGVFRVVGVTRVDGAGALVLNGVPQQRLHVSGLVQVDGEPPEAVGVDVHLGAADTPDVGAVLPAEVLRRDPLRVQVAWRASGDQQRVQAAQQDAVAQVVADLAASGRTHQVAGESTPLGVALTAPAATETIADQLAAVLGTPISVDIDVDGVLQHRTANRSGRLSSAEAAELLRTGTAATAVIDDATRVPVPSTMLPGPDASLWDLALTVRRPDGSTYGATTRVGFRTEARRLAVGAPGRTVPVRIDPADDGRVAIDSARFDAEHPGAPPS